jgi:Sec-independent protein translocase protein TatA
MFGIGPSEFFIIALVIIIFVKPKDLPSVFRFLGKIAGKAKAAYDEAALFKDQIISEIDNAADFEKALPPKESACGDKAPLPTPDAELATEQKLEYNAGHE